MSSWDLGVAPPHGLADGLITAAKDAADNRANPVKPYR